MNLDFFQMLLDARRSDSKDKIAPMRDFFTRMLGTVGYQGNKISVSPIVIENVMSLRPGLGLTLDAWKYCLPGDAGEDVYNNAAVDKDWGLRSSAAKKNWLFGTLYTCCENYQIGANAATMEWNAHTVINMGPGLLPGLKTIMHKAQGGNVFYEPQIFYNHLFSGFKMYLTQGVTEDYELSMQYQFVGIKISTE